MADDGNKMLLMTFSSNLAAGETSLAYGFRTPPKTIWIPKSQIKNFEDNGTDCRFTLPAWLVEKNNLHAFIDTSEMPSLFGDMK